MNNSVFEKLQSVYYRLQDEESRYIFEKRLMYCLNGSLKNVSDMVEYSRQNSKVKTCFQNSYNAKPGKIVFYGAGNRLMDMLSVARFHYNFNIECVCDGDPAKQGTIIHGIKVISPDVLFSEYTDAYVVISSIDYMEDIRQLLLERGIPDGRIFDFETFHHQSYFIPEFKPSDEEIYVDAGCYGGEDIIDFYKFAEGVNIRRIYGFEPNPINYKRAVANTKELKNTFIYNLGVWSKKASLPFDNLANSASGISEKGGTTIHVDSIDNIVSGEKVTTIKMDIEGAELEALRGAQNTIRNHKPRMAICIYHKPADVLDIPLYILSLVPEYRFYIRHQSVSEYETVLFAQI